ncbi:hypothetical protein [Burkholderia gladioli]|uniref:hypothetical protein n=1 Tax=Burkholderia gladioli TaxID=28095 RepID=UPI00164102EC|nr:hypothetical protein [Burkholderia gladioli]
MVTILLEAGQGCGKTSIWAPALKAHFASLGLNILVVEDDDGASTSDAGHDVRIVNSNCLHDPAADYDFVVSIGAADGAMEKLWKSVEDRARAKQRIALEGCDGTPWPLLDDPSPGEQRFRRCAACSTWYGRFPYQSPTPCLCGQAVSDVESPSEARGKAPTHVPALLRLRNALVRALGSLTSSRLCPEAFRGRAAKLRPHSTSAPHTHQSPHPQRRSGTVSPSAISLIEKDSIADSVSILGKQNGGDRE